MALELIDLRAKITQEGDCALTAYAQAHDIDKAEVVRDIIHSWALKQMRAARILAVCMHAKGMTGADRGTSGSGVERELEP